MLSKGDTFQNYRVEKILQQHSMVHTYVVVHEKDQRRYILKVLKKDFQELPSVRKAFLGEYGLRAKVKHDHLVFVEQVSVGVPR